MTPLKSVPVEGEYSNSSYWNEIHASEAGKLTAVGYAALGEGFNKAAYKLRLRAVERILRRNGIHPRKTLEAAVGVGAYGPLWQRLGVESWTGLDISEVAIRSLTTRYPNSNFLVADLSQRHFDHKQIGSDFDLVTGIDVLYHLVDDGAFEAALANLANCVGRRGYLLLSDIFCETDRQTAAHVKRRALSTYDAILVNSGFKLVDREAVFAILGDPLSSSNRFSDTALFTAWRILSKLISVTPSFARNLVGGLLVRVLTPVDALLRRGGFARNVNLELVMFQRISSRDKPET